jgi:selT/selW/selH-like putative selenoprotein
LEAELAVDSNLTIELVEGDRGVFDVRADGTLIFSKRTEGRFPTAAEVQARLRKMAPGQAL